MPHCIIEHAEHLDSQVLINSVYQGALASNLFEPEQIKSRAISYSHYQTAGRQKAFVHVTLKILSGRTEQQKSQLSGLVFEQLKSLGLTDLSLTVEVVDIDRGSYSKAVL